MAMSFATDIVAALHASKVGNDANYKVGGNFNVQAKHILGNVTGVTVTAAGTGFTSIPAVVFGSLGNGAGVTAVARLKAVSATITGGTGHAVGDKITLSNGVVVQVATISTGAVATVTIFTAGLFDTAPNLTPTAVSTTGTGTLGALAIAVVYGVGAVLVTTNGGGFTAAPTATISGGAGSGATLTVAVNSVGANEQNIQALMETIRAYTAGMGSKMEAHLAAEILAHASSALRTTGSNTNLAANVQKVMLRAYADPRRPTIN